MRLHQDHQRAPFVADLGASTFLEAQHAVSQIVARIENRLLPPVIVEGRPLETKALAERMAQLNVPGAARPGDGEQVFSVPGAPCLVLRAQCTYHFAPSTEH